MHCDHVKGLFLSRMSHLCGTAWSTSEVFFAHWRYINQIIIIIIIIIIMNVIGRFRVTVWLL